MSNKIFIIKIADVISEYKDKFVLRLDAVTASKGYENTLSIFLTLI